MAGILELSQMEKTGQQLAQDTGFETESYRFIKYLLEHDKNLPAGVMEKFWPFFSKQMTLSNFNDKDVMTLLDDLKIAILDFKMSIPDFKKTYDDIMILDGLRPTVLAIVKRSTGGMMRERALEATQIKQFLTNEQERTSGGIMAKLGSIFGGRK